MALFNHATKEVTAKLVYYGPGLCGKTTNLQWIHDNLPSKTKGKLVSLATQTDRTLFFDFLPIDLGSIRGMRTRVQVYTVPGQVFYEATRRMVLKGCDAVVFVADSQAAMLDADAESLRSLRQNLLINEIDPAIPQVIQYNKRDLPTALPVAVLNARLNPRNLPCFEAVAVKGIGVEETLKGITKQLFQWLSRYYGEGDATTTEGIGAAPAREGEARGPVQVSVGVPNATLEMQPEEAPKPVEAQPQVFHEPETPAAPADPLPRGEGLRTDQWLYLLGGAQRGPVDVEDLIDLVLTSIPEDTKVWHPGLEGWARANLLREIADEIPPPLPVPDAPRDGHVEEDMPDFNTVPQMLRTVLIADEDAAFRKYLAMPLAAQGFTIYEAADGSAAWQIAVQNRPWVILADISMPEVDGFEFCRRVRNHPLLARMPILFISGSDKYKERYRALQIGADDFLSKSMPIRELLMRIQLLMTRYSDLAASGELKPGTTEVAGAFQGRIEVFGAPALLQMCSQGRLTGLFTALAEDAANTATIMGFREGDIISAAAGTARGADGVYAFLAWEKGSFKFTPGDPGSGEPLAQSVEHLLLEGCRLLDESRKQGSDEAGAP
jgi:mutual gliding-motility protein MglA